MKTSRKFFHQLLMLYRPFENQLVELLGEHKLQRAQWTILYYLFNYGDATLVELSNYQGVEKPTITRTVHQLKDLEYIERVPSQDKREKRIQLSELGRKVYKEVRVTLDQFEEDILQGISETEQLDAIRIMSEIRNNLIN
ncbi:MarR family winged helix-turn-helix transcriptional regulator [Robertmurraya sp. Marseille-Q9965]